MRALCRRALFYFLFYFGLLVVWARSCQLPCSELEYGITYIIVIDLAMGHAAFDLLFLWP